MKNLGFIIVWFLLLVAQPMRAQSMRGSTAIPHAGKPGDLAEVLQFVAKQFQVPIIAELVAENKQAKLPAGTHTAAKALQLVLRDFPGYRWKVRRNVYFVYEERLVRSPNNILEHKFKGAYRIPSNLGDLQLQMIAGLDSARLKGDEHGFVLNGVVSTEVHNTPLVPRVLYNVSARDALLTAAEDKRFYSIFTFKNSHPHGDEHLTFSDEDWNYMSQHWLLGSLVWPAH